MKATMRISSPQRGQASGSTSKMRLSNSAQRRALYGGRVIGIDVPLAELGSFQGLLWEGGEMFRVLGNGKRDVLIAGG
jgi:hypothetical protein